MRADTDIGPRLIHLNKVGDPSIGYIAILEPPAAPFIAKRVYWTYGTPGDVARGNHAHKSLQQVLIAVSGKVSVSTESTLAVRGEFLLDNPSQGLYLPAGCWRRLQFSPDAILVTLASEVFDEDDYIRNYDEFRDWVNSSGAR